MSDQVRYENFKVRAVPSDTTVAGAQIDRIQDIKGTQNLNRTPNDEVGNPDTIDYSQGIPDVPITVNQNCHNNIEFFRKLANIASGKVQLSDYKTSVTDIVAYLTGDTGTFLGSYWYPEQRVTGFTINVSDYQSKITQNFNMTGEDFWSFQNLQKYVISLEEVADTAEVAGGDWEKTLNDPVPVESANTTDKYLYRVTRVRSGTSTDLDEGTGTNEYEYDSVTNVLTVHDAVVGDTYKLWYTSGSYIAGSDIFTANAADPGAVQAYNISMWLGSAASQLTRIQSVDIAATLTRDDKGEVGNNKKVVYGVTDQAVTLTLPRFLENYTLDEVLLGKSADYSEIDLRESLSNISFVMKVYEGTAKTTFSWGVKIVNLTPTGVDSGVAVKQYAGRDLSLVSNSTNAIIISDVESDIDF